LTGRERVHRLIRREKIDRIPLYGWVRANLEDKIAAAFGSVENFEDRYEFDLAHIFGGPPTYSSSLIKQLHKEKGGVIEPKDLLSISPTDPDNQEAYAEMIKKIRFYQDERQRFVYVQTPGIFEALNSIFGIENHLAYMLLYEDDLRQVYRRQAEWNRRFALNCIELGVDMVHVSDDWGGQHNLLFSPALLHSLIIPYHQVTVEAVKQAGCLISMHSDGNINDALDAIAALGYDVLHPYQESAGMDYQVYKSRYADRFVLMGGLDVQTTIGFGKPDFLKKEIYRVTDTFRDGGLIFCTSHFVQDHCSIDELTYAFDIEYEAVRRR